MTHAELMNELQDIFRELFEDENIVIEDSTMAADIEDWDSLTHLELIATVEARFHIRFTLGEINSFGNVGEMCDCILKHLVH